MPARRTNEMTPFDQEYLPILPPMVEMQSASAGTLRPPKNTVHFRLVDRQQLSVSLSTRVSEMRADQNPDIGSEEQKVSYRVGRREE
jgi:hypothetical protein